MKPWLLFALLAAPLPALAQTTSSAAPAPFTTPASKSDLPDARELLGHLFDPYEAARSFRGTFIIDLNPTGDKTPQPFSSVTLTTLFSLDDRGNVARQSVRLTISRKKDPQEFLYLDDGRNQRTVNLKRKVWAPSQREVEVALTGLVKPLLQQITKRVNDDATINLVIEKGIAAGQEVYVVRDERNSVLRVVVDAQTRALRSLDYLSDGGFSIKASDQAFNPTLSEAEFAWTPPAGFRQVKEGGLKMPTF